MKKPNIIGWTAALSALSMMAEGQLDSAKPSIIKMFAQADSEGQQTS